MKKIFNYFLLIILLANSNFCSAQVAINPIDSVNKELRLMFSNTIPPSPSTGYLFDLAAHTTDSQFFEPIVPLLSNTENWFMIFEEMNNMAYDTTNNIDSDTLYKDAFLRSQNDTVQIGILYKNYFTLTSDALNTGLYFDYDTVNTLLFDKEGRPDGICGNGPYCTKTIFSIATLSEEINYSEFTFAIDPRYLFNDSFNSNPDLIYKLYLDDGNSPQIIDPSTLSYIHVNYSTIGDKNIKIEVYEGSTLIAQSSCVLSVLRQGVYTMPDYNVDYEGLYVSVFGSCVSDDSQRKIVIVLEGIDPFDVLGKNVGHSASEVYDDAIRIPRVEELRRYGYEFWVVNWKRSMNDVRTNADYVINMIQDLKQNINTNNQFVIIGVSLGGVVATCALTKMEHDNIDHKTRELITIDSPHGGANVPLSIQLFYRDIVYLLTPKIFGFKFRFLANYCKIGLDSKAAKQLLLYHVNTANDFCDASIYKCYEAASDRAGLIATMESYGSYPQHCKIVAVTDGSLTGEMQNRAYNNDFRTAGDKLLDFNGEIYVKILKIFTVRLWGVDLELNTNPNGDGKLYQFNAGLWMPKIKLYWFGVKLKKPKYSTMWDFEEYGNDIKPFCVNAGGILSLNFMQPNNNATSYNSSKDWALIFNVKKSNSGNGLYTFESNVGNPWVVSLNANFSIYSDGFHFGFIPVQSSIAYSGFPTNALNKNLVGTQPSTIMTMTPFDVVIGPSRGYVVPNGDDSLYNQAHNLDHVSLDMINSKIPSSCAGFDLNECGNEKQVLNTEIGENILWLDNFTVNQSNNVRFSANEAILINDFSNPFYAYAGENLSICFTNQPLGFSKKGNYDVVTTSTVEYKTQTLSMTGVSTHNYIETQDPDPICCSLILRGVNISDEYFKEELKSDENNIYVYPNAFNQELTLLFNMQSKQVNSIATISILDVLGRELLNIQEAVPNNNEILLNLNSIDLKTGTYFVKILINNEIHTFKVYKRE